MQSPSTTAISHNAGPRGEQHGKRQRLQPQRPLSGAWENYNPLDTFHYYHEKYNTETICCGDAVLFSRSVVLRNYKPSLDNLYPMGTGHENKSLKFWILCNNDPLVYIEFRKRALSW